MFPDPRKARANPGGIRWDAWSGSCGADQADRAVPEDRRVPGALAANRAKANAFFLSGGGDPLTGEKAAAFCVDSFLRRPSLKPFALQTIFGFVNNLVMARGKPGDNLSFDAAVCFMFKDQAAWVISGTAALLMFVDGKLLRKSSAKRYPCLGVTPSYQAEAESVFSMPRDCRERIAILMCSGISSDALDAERLERELANAEAPGAWLEAATPHMLPEVAALAVFLPPRKRLFGLAPPPG